MDLEHKFARLTDVSISVDAKNGRVIEGYASLFGSVDQGNDVVDKGAYAGSLGRLAAKGARVKMLWQHDPAEPIGVWDEVREDARGLFVKGRILADVARGREAVALIDAGAIDGLSIGYRTVRATKDAQGRRRLTELDLWEVSVVTFPMLPEARVAAGAPADKGDAPAGAMTDDDAQTLRDMAQAFDAATEELRAG